jgi:3-phosphoinositide dependent protein kinase-1
VKGAASSDQSRPSATEWIECLERAKEMALSQSNGNYSGDNSFSEMPSTMSSPASTMAGRPTYSEGFGVSDWSGRNHLSKSQGNAEDPAPKRNRFSKRQSRSGLGSAF